MVDISAMDMKALLAEKLPAVDQHDEIVEFVGNDELHIRSPFQACYLGKDTWQQSAGVVFSGPMVMGLADTAMYACLHGAFGRDVVPVIVSLTITFLEPASAGDLTAKARIVRKGRRLTYLETTLFSEDREAPIAHVTATYAVRRTGAS
jgi:acyl-coenzyme A thioesterase PaaI-like protein